MKRLRKSGLPPRPLNATKDRPAKNAGGVHRDRSSRFWAIETAKRWLTSDGMIVQYAADDRDVDASGSMKVGAIAFLDLATGEVYSRHVNQQSVGLDIANSREPITEEAALLAWAGRIVRAKSQACPTGIWIFHNADPLVYGARSLQRRAEILAQDAPALAAADLAALRFEPANVRRLLPLAAGYKMSGAKQLDSRDFFSLLIDKFRLKFPGYQEGAVEAALCKGGDFKPAADSAEAKVRMFKAALGVFASNPWGSRGWSMARQRMIDFVYSPLGFWGGIVIAAAIGFNSLASLPESVSKVGRSVSPLAAAMGGATATTVERQPVPVAPNGDAPAHH